MSSYNGPQQYHVDPPPQQPYQQPYAQPPVQPYVEQPGPYQAAGGQPPYQPPGGYAPLPPPPPRPRRRGRLVIASILSVALLIGVGAFVFFQFIWTSGPDPAERFPATASMYVEVNLDPSFDQTPKLLEHLSKFEGLDYADTDDLFADLIDKAGLEGVDAERDLNSWLGRRHGFALWEHDGTPYGVVNLASTDAEAAEAGLERIRDAAGVSEEEWAYSVKDDSVLMVVGDDHASSALAAAESETESSALSDALGYSDARSWLDGDQLLVYWIDLNRVAEMAEALGESEQIELFESMYSGHAIVGVSAFDDGFEMAYRSFGTEDDPWTGSEDLLDDMGDMPAADLAVVADVPEELAEVTEDWVNQFGGSSDSVGEIGGPEGDPLTDEEYEEYLELDEKWWDDDLSPEEEERYGELSDRYWQFGTEDDPFEYDYGEDYGNDFQDEILGSLEELVDLLAGAQLSIAVDFPSPGEEFDPQTIFFRVLLAEDRASELDELIDEVDGDKELPDGVEVDGSSLTFQGGNVPSGTLSEDDRFSDFAAAAPDSTAVAVWVELSDLAGFDEDFQAAEPLSAFTWAHGTVDGDGTGLARLYLK